MRLRGCFSDGQIETLKYYKKSTAALTLGCTAIVVGIIMGLVTYLSNPTSSFQWDRLTPSLATIGGGCFLAILGEIGFVVNKEKESRGRISQHENSVSENAHNLDDRYGDYEDPDSRIDAGLHSGHFHSED